jgi:hypothetical protein
VVHDHVDIASAGTHQLPCAQHRLYKQRLLNGIIDRDLVVGRLPRQNMKARLGLLHRGLSRRILHLQTPLRRHDLLPTVLLRIIIPTLPLLPLRFPLYLTNLISKSPYFLTYAHAGTAHGRSSSPCPRPVFYESYTC